MAKIGKYDLFNTLGSGGFAKVKLGIHCETEEQVALKIMKRHEDMNPALLELVSNEVDILRDLDHKHIIKFIDFLETDTESKADGTEKDVFAIVLEFAQNGELFNLIAQGGGFPENIT
jgi:serine/threonine protein kinase